MGRNRRAFTRSIGNKPYKKLFVLAVEGSKTEPQYFRLFNNRDAVVRIVFLKSKASAPHYILKSMKDFLAENPLKQNDWAWIVADKDYWTEEQLGSLCEWSQESDNYGLAVSNPKFEFWLLLHFEDGSNATSSAQCDDRLRRHVPDYDKDIDPSKFTDTAIRKAINYARQRDNPPSNDWPRKPGTTTVYKLVELLIQK